MRKISIPLFSPFSVNLFWGYAVEREIKRERESEIFCPAMIRLNKQTIQNFHLHVVPQLSLHASITRGWGTCDYNCQKYKVDSNYVMLTTNYIIIATFLRMYRRYYRSKMSTSDIQIHHTKNQVIIVSIPRKSFK